MEADMILVDLKEMLQEPCVLPGFDMGEVLLRRGLGRQVDTVVIGGKKVMEGRRLLTVDVEALYEEVRGQAAAGRTPAQLENEAFLERLRPYYQAWYEGWLKDVELEPFYLFNSRT